VKDRKFHINKQLNNDYPSPDVPADEAWAQMNSMLDAGKPKPAEPAVNGRFGNNLLKLSALLIAAAAITMLVSKPNKQSVKTDKRKINYTSVNKKDASVSKMHDKQDANETERNNNSDDARTGMNITPATGTVLGKRMNKADSSFAERRVSSLHHRAISRNQKDNASNTKDNNITVRATRNNTMANDNRDNSKPGNRVTTYHDNKNITSEKGIVAIKNQRYNDKQEIESGITISSRPAFPLDTSFISLIIPQELTVSSEQQLRDSLFAIAYAKRKKGISGKSNTAITKILTGFSYGLQWEIPVPLEGSRYYFKGTNGVSKPYNILVPQLWVRKSLSKKSSLLLTLNFNQQYFINNKELSEITFFMAPRDTITSRKSLYKTGGFGGTISYSHKIYKRWSGAVGINYTLNRTALIDKQGINTYIRVKMSDSLYRIDRHSFDWQYINKSILSARLELYYDFKKFNIGASANLPLSTTPANGSNPVSAQLFLRWNIAGH
jgi:hypothetical protein